MDMLYTDKSEWNFKKEQDVHNIKVCMYSIVIFYLVLNTSASFEKENCFFLII